MRQMLPATMLFSHAGQDWQTVPPWGEFFLRLGYNWRNPAVDVRRIALVSMPCDSAAAGLAALGALVRDLCDPGANDLDGHFTAMLLYARQYLRWCRGCTARCRPSERGCEHVAEVSGRVRHLTRGFFRITQLGLREKRLVVTHERRAYTMQVDARRAIDWQIDGEPPPLSLTSEGALAEESYASIVDSAQLAPENLRLSYSGLCLAGRSSGSAPTRAAYDAIRLRVRGTGVTLAQMLTIQSWSSSRAISRLNYFNTRTGAADRNLAAPALVLADGAQSFLRVVGTKEFQRSDIVAVIDRSVDREVLEPVGHKVQSLRQWYEEDLDLVAGLPAVPRGVRLLGLRGRRA